MTALEQKSLLFVDEDAVEGLVCVERLKKCGYHVIVANTSDRALQIVRENSDIDLILLDFDLRTGIDGVEAARQIGALCRFPIIFRTSHLDHAAREKLHAIPSYGCLLKNADDATLQSSIETALLLFAKLETSQDNEHRYQRIIAGLTDYLYSVRIQDGLAIETIHGDGCEQITGYTKEEYAADPQLWLRMIKDEDRDAVVEQITAILSGKIPSFIEHRIVRKDGAVRWVSDTIIPQLDSLGQLKSYDGNVKDITVRKQAEENLTASEARYRYMFEQNPVPMLIYDLQTRDLLAVNDAFIISYGYTASEAKSLSLLDLYPESEKQSINELISHLHGIAYAGEWHHLKKDGSLITVEAYSHAFIYEGREARIAVVTDISERKMTEEALRERERQISLIYDTVGDTIFNVKVEHDDTYCFSSVNKRFLSTTGLPINQIVGRRVQDIIPEPSLSLVLAHYAEAIREKKIVRWEETSEYPTGRLVGEVSIAPVFDDSEKCVSLVGSVHDITDRKKAEAEIRHLNDDLERRVAQRTAQLEAINNELEAFSYSVSHDLRAPLRHASGYVDLLLKRCKSDLTEKGQHYLASIADSVHQMGMLIDDLLQFSRTGRTELLQSFNDMKEIVEEVIVPLHHETSTRTIEWVIGPLPKVFCDRMMLKLVWSNLLGNAVKFTRTRSVARIEIGYMEENNEFVFFVRDNGVGFDMQYAQKLFGVFQRLHTIEEFEGTGIGLANVHRIIAKHGGRTWAAAELDKGATFYFTLHS
jgi:PAS domain S-box-containing protein